MDARLQTACIAPLKVGIVQELLERKHGGLRNKMNHCPVFRSELFFTLLVSCALNLLWFGRRVLEESVFPCAVFYFINYIRLPHAGRILSFIRSTKQTAGRARETAAGG